MSITRGVNAGVQGYISIAIDGTNPPDGLPAYACKVEGFSWEGALSPINRSGRVARPKFRLGDFYGNGTFKGLDQISTYPWPSIPKFATGTLKIVQQQTDDSTQTNYISFPIRISNMRVSAEDEAQNVWSYSGDWIVDGAITIVWQGTQVVITAPSPNDAETDAGLSKTYDVQNLRTAATQRVDCEIVSDTDAAEVAKLAAYVAAAVAPMPNLKVVTAVWERSDSAGGTIRIQWGLNDSKDDFQLPATRTTLDPSNLVNQASIGKINDTGTQTLSGFTPRTVTTLNVTPGSTFTRTELGLRTTKEDRTFPGTFTILDNNSINTVGRVTQISNNSAPTYSPTSPLKIGDTTTRQLTSSLGTNNQYETVWNLVLNDSDDEILNGGQFSTRSPMQGNTRADILIINSTQSADDLATTTFLTAQTESFFVNLRARKRTPGVGVVVKQYVNPGTLVISKLFSRPRYVIARINGSTVEVWVAQKWTRGTGRYLYRIQRTLVNSPVRLITVRRSLTGTTVPDYPSQVNTTNAAAFLGLSAGTVYYQGAKDSTNIGISGTRPFLIDYQFINDPNGIFDFTGFAGGLVESSASLSVGSGAWINASSITGSGFAYVIPSTSDFSVFA